MESERCSTATPRFRTIAVGPPFLVDSRQQREGFGAAWNGFHHRAHDQQGEPLRPALAGRLDGGHHGRAAIGAVRAHGARDGGRAGDPDRVAQVLRHLEAGHRDAAVRSDDVPEGMRVLVEMEGAMACLLNTDLGGEWSWSGGEGSVNRGECGSRGGESGGKENEKERVLDKR